MGSIMTLREAALYLKCGRTKLYELCRQEVIPHFTIGNRIKFSSSQLDAWISDQTKKEGRAQHKLASISDVSQPFICESETGRKQSTVAIALKLASALGETLSNLVEIEPAEQKGRG